MPKDTPKIQLQTEDALESEMTFREFVMFVAEDDMSKAEKLKLYNKVGDLLIQKIFLMIFDARDKQELVHMGGLMDDFILVKSKFGKRFDPLNPKTMEFEALPNFELSLFRNREHSYSRLTFDTWDGDFLAKLFDLRYMTKAQKNACFSFEMYLGAYMYAHKEEGKSGTFWIEDMVNDEKLMRVFKKNKNILYYVLPKMAEILTTQKQYYKKYKSFEKKLMAAIRILSDTDPKDQYTILKSSNKLRNFIDALKTRSHLPTLYGMYIMNMFEALQISEKTVRKSINQPNKGPKPLKTMLGYYWLQLLLPFKDD